MGKTRKNTEKSKNYFWDRYESLNEQQKKAFKNSLSAREISPRRFVETDSFRPLEDIAPKVSRVYAELLGVSRHKVIIDSFGKEFFAKASQEEVPTDLEACNFHKTL